MNKYPTIKLAVFFITGLLLHKIFRIPETYIYISFGLLFSLSLLSFFSVSQKLKSVLLFSLPLTIIVSGILYSSFRVTHTAAYPFSKEKIKNAKLFGRVAEINLIGEGRLNFLMETDSIVSADEAFRHPLKVKCGIYDSRRNLKRIYSELRIGNTIIFTADIKRPLDKRNPGGFDYEKYLHGKGITALASSYKTANLIISDSSVSQPGQFILNVRRGIDGQISRFLSRSASSLIRGLLLADRSLIDDETQEQFINAGVVHVLAVSGLHVGFILLIFMLIFGRLNIYLKYLATIAGLFAFLIITGSQPSVFRATVMSAVFLIAYLTNRSYNSLNALSIAALIILIINPEELYNAGFQLSFSAVLSILLLYPVFSRKLGGMKIGNTVLKNILLFALLSISAQIGTLPFTLAYFGKLSLAAVFANIFVIPLIGLIAGVSIFTLFLGVFWASAAHLYGSAINLSVYALYWIVERFGSSDLSYLNITQFSIYDSIVFYIMLIIFIFSVIKLSSLKAKIIIFLLCMSNLYAYTYLDNYSLAPPGKLTVITADIGQGDASIIMMPDGQNVLIDAGDATEYFDNGKKILLPLMNMLGIKHFDYVFISHVDADHYLGSVSMIKAGAIPLLYKPELDTSADKDREYEKLLAENNVAVKYYSRKIINTGNARIYILNDTTGSGNEAMDSNDRSGIIKIVYGRTSLLFVGDAGIKAENKLLNRYKAFLNSDVLKVGHHGSKSSSGEKFISAVSPSFALISAGIMNKFGHPAEQILRRLEAANTEILRTDKSGAIILRSDGEYLQNIDWKKSESSYILE